MPKIGPVRARWLTRIRCCLLGAGFAVVRATPAAAELAELNVERAAGAESCPDEGSLRRAVQALGNDAVAKRDPLGASVRFGRDETQAFTAVIELFGGGRGRRELSAHGDDCQELADAVAVAVAMALDGSQSGAAEPTPPQVEQTKPASALVPPRARSRTQAVQVTPPHEPATRSTRPLRLALGPELGLGYDLVGSVPSLTLRGLVSLESGRYQLGLSGIWIQPRDISYAPGRVEVALWAGALHFCVGGAPTAKPSWALCPALLAGEFRAKARGYDFNGSQRHAWFAFAASGALRFPITRRVSVELRSSVIVPLERERLIVRNVGRAFESPAVGGMFELGPILTLL